MRFEKLPNEINVTTAIVGEDVGKRDPYTLLVGM
jgi:hypothetical protein